MSKETKYIFVTGGVLSSLGKGIAAASIATLLKNVGYKVSMLKADPYINVDPGTMSPLEHGEVFVTDDGHTRIYMHLREPKMASKEMPFCIQEMAGTVTIDWGDNSQPETITAAGVYSHLWQVNS